MASVSFSKINAIPGGSRVLDSFARFPNKTTAKVAGAVALCALVHLAQKKAATLQGKKQTPSLLIRMADRGGIAALANFFYYSAAISRDYKDQLCTVKTQKGSVITDEENKFATLYKNATHNSTFKPQMLLTGFICTALVFFKYNRAAMTGYFLSEVLLSYKSKDNRKAVREFAKRELPQEIKNVADAKKMLGFAADQQVSFLEVCNRYSLLNSVCKALAIYDEKNSVQSLQSTHKFISDIQQNLVAAQCSLKLQLTP